MSPRTLLVPGLTAVALAIGAGWRFAPAAPGPAAVVQRPDAPPSASRAVYACPMHPEVTSDRPGRCPICGMDLVRLPGGRDHAHAEAPAASMSPALARPAAPAGHDDATVMEVPAEQQRRIGVLTQRVTVSRWAPRTPLVAQVIADEGRAVSLSPKVEGWIRRLGVSVVGQPVRQGQLLFEIYSPDLQQRQRDYLDLLARRDTLASRAGGMGAGGGASMDLMLASVARERFRARERLLAADVPESVVVDIETSRKVRDVVPVLSAHDGVVTAIGAREGAYVTPAQTVVSYADLGTVWVDLSLPPEDLARVRPGQRVELQAAARPDQVVAVTIDPRRAIVDPASRQARLRIPLPPGTRGLLPGMTVEARLVGEPREGIVVPRDAVSTTASGSQVIVADDGTHFHAAAVELGRGDGEDVEVRRGVEAGNAVVVNGQFLLGAEASLAASRLRMEARRRDAEAAQPPTSAGTLHHAQ